MGEPRERRLIAEYLALKFPDRRYATDFPLGPAPGLADGAEQDAAAARMGRPWRPRIDGIVWFDGALLLIEAKLMKWREGMGQLVMDAALVPSTLELEEARAWPVRMRLVTPWSAPWIEVAAAAQGIEIDIFAPEWVVPFMDSMHRYWTAEYRTARAARNAERARLGLE